jgi:signal transduction histidine kinase
MSKDFSLPQNKQPGDIVGCVHALNSPSGCGRSQHCPSCPIRNSFEQVLKTGEPMHNIETQVTLFLNGENNSLWFEVNVDPMVLDGKRHAILSLNNITVRKQAEDVLMRDKDNFKKLVHEKTRELMKVQMELEQAKRLSDIGTLAATVAHELRNPLAAIKMASYNAQRKAQNPLLDKHFSNIEIKLRESENIIDNLLFYSKIRISHCAPINIHNILGVCIKDTKDRFPGYKISIIRKDGPLKKLLVEADAVQIREIFANLLNNSFDAVGQKGGIIETKARVEGGSVRISVKDNGAGINKENLEKIFQPFFSTKAKGTGLGLTVAQQVVKLHGGSIEMKSQESRGTTVTISLPIKHELNA